MKKIMLVDDEILTRESIRNCVDWKTEGFIYCGDAGDGEMALPLIEEWRPQIVITDIKMPFMDGLELAAIVRKSYPHIKIIILSGHDEFHYAQQAIRIGVEDYCLKPVGSDDLIELLKKVSKQIDAEQQRRETSSYTEDKLLADLCGGLISTSKAIEVASRFSISLIAHYYAVVSIDFLFHNDSVEESCYNRAKEQFASCFQAGLDVLSYRPSRSELVCIIKANEQHELQQCLIRLPHQIKPLLQSLNSEVALGVGTIEQRLQSIHRSYQKADDEKNRHRLAMRSRLEAHDFLKDSTFQQPLVNRAKLIDFIKIGTADQLEAFLQTFCKDVEQLPWNTSMYGIYLLNELTLEAFHTAKLCFPVIPDSSEHVIRMQQRVKEITSLEQCKSYLSDLLSLLWQWRSIGSNQYSELIMKVKQYIVEHYHDSHLSLQKVASYVGVSASHLSKVFSQETKQTLTEFITQTRIQKAMELLKTTHCKTFEIANDIGYQDQHYFSNIFKKATGMTPIEFRKQGSISTTHSDPFYFTGGLMNAAVEKS